MKLHITRPSSSPYLLSVRFKYSLQLTLLKHRQSNGRSWEWPVLNVEMNSSFVMGKVFPEMEKEGAIVSSLF
jgi:hypothetical protein